MSQEELQKHVAEKCRRDRKAKRGAAIKITLYTIGAGLEYYAYRLGELPALLTTDNLFGFGGATVAAATSVHAARKGRKHEAQLDDIRRRCAENEITAEESDRETEHHLDHRRADTKRYVKLTAGGSALSVIGFGHELASGHADNHWALFAAALSVVAANAYSVKSLTNGIRQIKDDKRAVKSLARRRQGLGHG